MTRFGIAAAALLSIAATGTVLAQQAAPPPAPAASPAPAAATATPGAPAAATPPRPRGAGQIFTDTCAGCHGSDLAGARAPSLFTEQFLTAHNDEQIRQAISDGVQGSEMPAFKGTLDDAQIWQMVAYLRNRGADLKGHPTFVPDPNNQVIESQKQKFRIEVVAPGLETPWGLAFLPDGRLLVTERPGRLRIIQHGKLLPEPVKNTPKVWERQDSGMLDVALHPDYKRNHWVYLAYTDVVPGYVAPPAPADPASARRQPAPPSMTVLIRGRINARNEWVDQQEIWRSPPELYTSNGAHYGTRFLFDGKGHLFFSLGERGEMTNAQRLDTPLGKIHRINDDGTIPADNPFVNTPGAVKSIWTYGHRNPQGLSFDPVTGLMWESEHGPTGGDEINIIEKGKNYGWGVISMGIQPGITKQHQDGMEDPIAYYTPTIAPSGISFYKGNKYPAWKNNLFVAALAGQKLLRLEIDGRRIVSQEAVYQQFGRTRAVITGPDGLLYVLLQNPTGGGTNLSLSASTPGMVIKLVPLK